VTKQSYTSIHYNVDRKIWHKCTTAISCDHANKRTIE